MVTLSSATTIIALTASLSLKACNPLSIRPQSSHFLGKNVDPILQGSSSNRSTRIITMRKQKASNKRTRRSQRGERDNYESFSSRNDNIISSLASPIATGSWNYKSMSSAPVKNSFPKTNERGRGRSRKRSQFYNSLSSYHSHFLRLITDEFLAEEQSVRQRIESSSDNPLSLEIAGHALFDLYPERRGNIFSDEVYRLVKSHDATSVYSSFNEQQENNTKDQMGKNHNGIPLQSTLPPNSKFSQNDVIMLTLQPGGTGDFFSHTTMPTNSDAATSIEARVLNTGPSYIDVALPGGKFESIFGPAPNNRGPSGKGDPKLRLRADRYFSNVPYTRMVGALSQLTSIDNGNSNGDGNQRVDDSIRQAILTSFGYDDPSNPLFQNAEACNLQELSKQLSRPPLRDSTKLANEVLNYLQSDDLSNQFTRFNGPQLSCIGAALTRKLTMIQGPPGTGKTTVAASIAFGFVHQCRSLSSNHKVLATAFSNCGADNLAERLLRTGLKVVRIGKASAVSPRLWDYTLDAAIDRDPKAKKAMEEATVATANANGSVKKSSSKKARSKIDQANERNKRDIATRAVKASMEACNVAATKAMREADVIVCTSIGAADTRLLAACGFEVDANDNKGPKPNMNSYYQDEIKNAPDDLPPLKLPFVLIDEACQSVEPGTLIPILSTGSCRSLVMLGDPCQLPPTVISDSSGQAKSPLAISLMSRLASTLPAPVVVSAQADKTPKEDYFLRLKATRDAISLIKRRNESGENMNVSYRKRFAGSMLLTVQYRMHPSIAAFSSSIFYDGLLSTPSFLCKARNLPEDFAKVLPIEKRLSGVRVVNIGGRNNEKRGDTNSPLEIYSSNEASPITQSLIANESISNEVEAAQIVSFLTEAMKNKGESHSSFKGSIGIITPYSAQVSLIKSLISSNTDLISLIKSKNVSIEVNSVDAFQGRECDVILFSAVRSNRRDNVGFLCDWRRMNVALTRAKSGLIVFGDMETLKRGDKHWEGFCTWAEDIGCIFDVHGLTDDNME